MPGCQLHIRKAANDALQRLPQRDARLCVDHMTRLAADESCPLDLPQRHIKRLPDDLRQIRKLKKGRHRLYYTGHATQCNYFLCHLKTFKRSGVEDDDSMEFQNRLRAALSAPALPSGEDV